MSSMCGHTMLLSNMSLTVGLKTVCDDLFNDIPCAVHPAQDGHHGGGGGARRPHARLPHLVYLPRLEGHNVSASISHGQPLQELTFAGNALVTLKPVASQLS